MARTKLSVTKALKRKQCNLNNSDVNENEISKNKVDRTVNVSFPRIYLNPVEIITPTETNDGWQWLLRHQEK